MISVKSPTQDGEVRAWQSHVEIQYVKPRGGSGFRFIRNGCGDKNSRPSLGLEMEKRGTCQGLTKSKMCRQAAAPALVFFKMCVAANLSDQFLNMRRESEVMTRSLENLTCLCRPRHPGHFFPKWIRRQMFRPSLRHNMGK